jgi:hypothetical protein
VAKRCHKEDVGEATAVIVSAGNGIGEAVAVLVGITGGLEVRIEVTVGGRGLVWGATVTLGVSPTIVSDWAG